MNARNFRISIALGLWLALGSVATACTTPVYRYAMYNWRVSPYAVFYFHRGDPAEEDAAVNKQIEDLAEAEPQPNVFLADVDLDDEDRMKLLDPRVRELCDKLGDDQLPTHLVVAPPAPYGELGVVFSGRLKTDDLKGMIDSPGRQKLVKMLDEGAAIVMLMVPGKDEKENQRAEKVVNDLIASATSNELPVEVPSLSPPPSAAPPEEPGEAAPEDAEAEDLEDTLESGAEPSDAEPADAEAESSEGEESDAAETPADQEPQAPGIKIAFVKISRSDPAEKWLIRQLMATESDLGEYVDEPMVFAVYGRGRAMPAYIGEGITEDNLLDVTMFLLSACSCFVKEQNPGVDLLVGWNWDATADRMAANDPTLSAEYGYPPYGEYYADESGNMVEASGEPSEEEAAALREAEELAAVGSTAAVLAGEEPPVPLTGETAEPEDPSAVEQPAEVPATAGGETPTGEAPLAEPADTAHDGSSEEATTAAHGGPASDSAREFSSDMAWRLAIGLAVGAVVIVLAGFVLVRKQG